ncbi:hypothetical protein D3C78_1191950 [compost metagenome]
MPRNEGVDGRAATQHAAYRQQHFQVIALLEQVAGGACVQRAQYRVLGAPGGDHQNAQGGIALAQLGDEINPAAVGQAQIHQGQRKRLGGHEPAGVCQGAGHMDGVGDIAQLAHDLEQAFLRGQRILDQQHGARKDGRGR